LQPENRIIVQPSRLVYYIHDSGESFRLQLLGILESADVKELQGCWNTAKTTLAGRKLIVDATGLQQIDESGREWLSAMVKEGASLLEQPRKTRATSYTSTVKADSVRVTG
jgi:hypothetical protein